MTNPLFAQSLPPLSGREWLIQAAKIWRRQPALALALTAVYLFTLMLVASIPVIGPFLPPIAASFLMVIIYNGFYLIDTHQLFSRKVLLNSIKERAPALAAVGAINMSIGMLLVASSILFDDGALFQVWLGKAVFNIRMLEGNIQIWSLLALMFSIPLSMACWFAPPLVAWGKLPAIKAMFFSFIACWRNMTPFLVFSLILMGGAMLLLIVLSILAQASTSLGAAGLFLAASIIVPIFLISGYTSLISVFGKLHPLSQNNDQ